VSALKSLHGPLRNEKFLQLRSLETKKLFALLIYRYKRKNLKYLRRYDLLYSINEKKFARYRLIPKLTSYLQNISSFAQKKIEYNIINLKSITYHPDLFIDALILKLTKKRLKLHKVLSRILSITKLPKVNTIKERTFIKDNSKSNLFTNRYKDLKVISNINNDIDYSHFSLEGKAKLGDKNNFNSLINTIHKGASSPLYGEDQLICGTADENNTIHPFIFNSIKYKNLGGMRLKLNGRLTKRYRADRAVHKLR
jgi:hypothetical protein